MLTIEFHDKGPDREDRRFFTLTWPIKPRLDGFPGAPVLVKRRAQCFNSRQWRDFLKRGAKDVSEAR